MLPKYHYVVVIESMIRRPRLFYFEHVVYSVTDRLRVAPIDRRSAFIYVPLTAAELILKRTLEQLDCPFNFPLQVRYLVADSVIDLYEQVAAWSEEHLLLTLLNQKF